MIMEQTTTINPKSSATPNPKIHPNTVQGIN